MAKSGINGFASRGIEVLLISIKALFSAQKLSQGGSIRLTLDLWLLKVLQTLATTPAPYDLAKSTNRRHNRRAGPARSCQLTVPSLVSSWVPLIGNEVSADASGSRACCSPPSPIHLGWEVVEGPGRPSRQGALYYIRTDVQHKLL